MSEFDTTRVTLPDGRVLRFLRVPARDPRTGLATAPGTCPRCAGSLVYPVAWEERVGSRWRLALRCPECEWRGRGEFEQSVVEAFDDELNDATERLLAALRRISRANMEADVERLVAAIRADVIHPIDF